MWVGSFGSTLAALGVVLGGRGAVSGVIVEVDEERLKVFARGARCVSFSSAEGQQKSMGQGDGQYSW
jgi:hypothetical protein